MANWLNNTAKHEIFSQALDLSTGNIEIILANTTYTPDLDDDVVDAGGANDALDGEINATNYASGHAGAGRHKANTNGAFNVDKTNDRAEFDADDPTTWTALGGASNDTITYVLVIKRGTTNDTDARLIGKIDTATGSPSLPFLTNGSDFTINYNTEGMFHIS